MSKKKAIAKTENGSALLVYDELPLPVLSQRQFEVLTQKTPPHAIKVREDGYKYVASGWIKHVLFQAFALDWDWEMLPIENGMYYALRQREEHSRRLGKMVKVDYVATIGRLTVRVRDAKTLKVIGEIRKTGVGSQVWRDKMELGDAIKGADTDALRNAAFKLGIAADYKWDDDAERVQYDQAQVILNHAVNAVMPGKPLEPHSLAEFIVAIDNLQLTLDEAAQKCGLASADALYELNEAQIAEAWAKIKEGK